MSQGGRGVATWNERKEFGSGTVWCSPVSGGRGGEQAGEFYAGRGVLWCRVVATRNESLKRFLRWVVKLSTADGRTRYSTRRPLGSPCVDAGLTVSTVVSAGSGGRTVTLP